MKKKTYKDEIDISDIFINLWNNKIQIIIITVACVILGYLYSYSLNKTLSAKTNIKSVSSHETQKYNLFNDIIFQIFTDNILDDNEKKFTPINSESLLNIFIDKLKNREIVEEGIIKFNLLNKDKFQNEDVYKEAVESTSILIIESIRPPLIDKKNQNKNFPYWSYNYEVSDKKKWKDFLKYMEKKANKEARQSLINQFNIEIEIMNNNFKQELKNIDQKIANTYEDYKVSIANKLAYLNEQAEIARALNIAKKTFEVENIQNDMLIITDTKPENSYYLKGYEMIEKEISIINSRKNIQAFIPNLINLQKSKRELLQNKDIETIKSLVSKTFITAEDNFIAAEIDYLTTIYKSKLSLLKIFLISVIIGLLISFVYISFHNTITSQK